MDRKRKELLRIWNEVNEQFPTKSDDFRVQTTLAKYNEENKDEADEMDFIDALEHGQK